MSSLYAADEDADDDDEAHADDDGDGDDDDSNDIVMIMMMLMMLKRVMLVSSPTSGFRRPASRSQEVKTPRSAFSLRLPHATRNVTSQHALRAHDANRP